MSTPATAEPTALEKATARTPAIITTPQEYRDALTRWAGNFNILTPFTNISGLAVQHGIIVSQIKINTDAAYGGKGGGGETYGGLPFLSKGSKGQGSPDEELAIAKIGLRKIAECGAISTSTLRTDPRNIQHYWEMKGIARYRGIDGAIITREATVEWDLRDGSDRLKGWTPNQISEARKNGLRNCEARAINAAIRECGCGIKQKYTRAELEKPFIVLRVAFQPDMSDPETKRLVTEHALGGANAMYPPTSHRELPAHDVADPPDEGGGQPRRVGGGSTQTAAAVAKPAESDPDAPPCEGAVRVVEIKSKTGEKNGRAWTCWTVVDSNGVEYSTFSKSLAESVERVRASKAWVEIVDEQNGEHRNIVEIAPAGQSPKLPEMENL